MRSLEQEGKEKVVMGFGFWFGILFYFFAPLPSTRKLLERDRPYRRSDL